VLTSHKRPTAGQAGLSPVEPLKNLLLAAPHQNSVVSARGVVILTDPVLYIQDSTGGVSILSAQAPPLNVGDEVEVTGIAEPRDFSASLVNATVHLLWAGVPDPPLAVTVSQAATGVFDARFVELEGYLDAIDESSGKNLILSLHNRDQRFRAILKGSFGNPARSLPAQDSLLRVRGVCSTSSEYTDNRTPFALLLRSTDDIERGWAALVERSKSYRNCRRRGFRRAAGVPVLHSRRTLETSRRDRGTTAIGARVT